MNVDKIIQLVNQHTVAKVYLAYLENDPSHLRASKSEPSDELEDAKADILERQRKFINAEVPFWTLSSYKGDNTYRRTLIDEKANQC